MPNWNSELRAATLKKNRELRDYSRRPWQMMFGFRNKIRTYDQTELIGNVALVTSVSKTYLTVVTHNLYRVEVFELLFEDFYRSFVLDAKITPEKAARELKNYCTTMLTVVPPARELINEILANPPTLEEVLLNKKKMSVAPAAIKLRASATVCADFNRRTCIEVDVDDGIVSFIPLDTSNGLVVVKCGQRDFDQRFKPLEDYPVEKAARLYAEYSLHVGATKEAMEYLAKLCPVLKEEIEMATTKKASVDATKAEKAAVEKAKAVKPKAAKTPASKKAVVVKPMPAAGEKKDSAAQMFKDLILEGKHTDDKIFETVQAKFGLDDKKRGYVKWYRNYLTKQGMNPPGPKE